MIPLSMPIIVEGKYDKIKLSSIFDGVIITTDGFRIFKDKQKTKLIKALAKDKGIIVLTDSDSAGNIIRSYLKNIVSEDKIYHIFLPRIEGKERRKAKPSSEGLLGVEGVEKDIILKAFERFLPNKHEAEIAHQEITTSFLMDMGLSGGSNSKQRRLFLLDKLGLPYAMSTSTFKKILETITTKEQIEKIMLDFKG
jgi:ribonuclease M5